MANSSVGKPHVRSFLPAALLISGLFMAVSLLQLLSLKYLIQFYVLAVLVALLSGYLFVRLFPYTSSQEDSKPWFILIAVTVLLSLALSSIVYYFTGLNFNFLTFQLAFTVPFLFNQAMVLFVSIPRPKYNFWYYPVHEKIEEIKMIDAEGSETVKFVLRKNLLAAKASRYTVNTPRDIPVGKLFSNLIYKYNREHETNTIQFADEKRNPVGWIFYRESKFFKTRTLVNPDFSFYENMLRPNQIVYAVREPESAEVTLNHFLD